jgi:hypothetical protein
MLFLIQLQRQSIGVGKKSKPFTGKFINADGFRYHIIFVQVKYGLFQIINLKC